MTCRERAREQLEYLDSASGGGWAASMADCVCTRASIGVSNEIKFMPN